MFLVVVEKWMGGCATKWMECNRIMTIQKVTAIDFNEQAMQIWQLRSQGVLFYGDVGKDVVNTHKHTGCVASCNHTHWMNLCRFLVNGFFTCAGARTGSVCLEEHQWPAILQELQGVGRPQNHHQVTLLCLSKGGQGIPKNRCDGCDLPLKFVLCFCSFDRRFAFFQKGITPPPQITKTYLVNG